MKKKFSISNELKTIIPRFQLLTTMETIKEHAAILEKLESQLKKCPKIGETEGMKEHPAIFHFFGNKSDFYICEYSPEADQMFGYSFINNDLENSEWGYFRASEFGESRLIELDYHFEEQSIEAALYNSYPEYFKKP